MKRDLAVFVGRKYESLAAEYLKEQGYEILERNFRCKIGEIDLIARDGEYLCFVEVKYRKNREFGGSFGAVDQRKQKRISRAALAYLAEKGYSMDTSCRFDVVGILDGEIQLVKDAFSFSGKVFL